MAYSRKITIIQSKKPIEDNVNQELQWFGTSLGLFGTRDKDKSCYRMFVVMLRGLHYDQGYTSDEIADRVGLSRGTVVHHLHKLMKSGIVISSAGRYHIKVESLTELVDEVERDILRTLKQLRKIAEVLDDKLDLK